MEQTSLDAYEKVKQWKTEAHERIYGIIQRRVEATLQDIARELNVPDHVISGRISELKEMKRIIVSGRTTNSAGNSCSVYAIHELEGGVI